MRDITKEKSVIYEIFGPGKEGVVVFAAAIWLAEDMLFVQKRPMDDIKVTKDIYPEVAEQMKKKTNAVARQIERIANQCWMHMSEEQKRKYIGKVLKDIRAPKDMIFYFAFYVHFGKGFYEVLKEQPQILF